MNFKLFLFIMMIFTGCSRDSKGILEYIKEKNELNTIERGVYSFYFFNDILFIGSDSDTLFYTFDTGKTWNFSKIDSGAHYIWDIKVTPENKILIIKDKTIYRSQLYLWQWEKIKIMPNAYFGPVQSSITFAQDSIIFIVSNYLYKSLYNSTNFERVGDFGNIDYARSIFISQDTIFVGTTQYADVPPALGKIYRSVDFGKNWDVIKTVYEEVSDFCKISNGYLFAATYKDIIFTKDNGSNWKSCGFNNYLYLDKFIRIVCNENQDIFAFTSSGKVYISADFGTSWQRGQDIPCVQNVFVDSQGYIYAGTCKGLFISKDNCKTWEKYVLFN